MNILTLCIGFLAQALFSARILVQWIMSERARRVLSPSIFWILSVIGSVLLCIYGWLRNDFAIILGQLISYYIYLWNLKAKGIWKELWHPARWLLLLLPVVLMLAVARDYQDVVARLFHNADIPLWLVIYGSLGQVIFTLRFVYQWFYSVKRGQSELPAGFWIISLAGSLIICSYAIYRHDPVLIVGQSFGLIAYTRNLMIGHKKPHTS